MADIFGAKDGRIFYGCPSPDAVPTSIWDVIKPGTYEPQEGWIELTTTSDKAADIEPTIEAGIVNSLQEECGRTAREHGFSRDWEYADYLETVATWLNKGSYQTAEMYVDLDRRPPANLSTDDGRLPAGDQVKLAAMALRNNILGNKLMLIVSELSEALESLRENGGAQGTLDGEGNFGEELADAIVRILDTGTFTKDMLGDQLLHKMAVNRSRPFMHGDKVM